MADVKLQWENCFLTKLSVAEARSLNHARVIGLEMLRRAADRGLVKFSRDEVGA
jgi:hypothetical protein